ncbi:hypothetical protein K2X14_07095 [Acetobacter sp. TBRC 12305]|uniref:Uncharacterized protein n=1 Tax=Acetobacter garciniae TaxID=2817435 RepID=A0A939KMT5_9PROT|nr:hypothetical protein [Acetobacter garciniae]MBO1324910.1 hypothetical protein [Acetobacter garciniae]MBX0344601.1 hypothetical protein [Acetobacter garciniae]
MQDQVVQPYSSPENASTGVTPLSAPATDDPVLRLDRALQRISFVLEKSRQKKSRGDTDRHELLANVDALILRVREALERTAPPPAVEEGPTDGTVAGVAPPDVSRAAVPQTGAPQAVAPNPSVPRLGTSQEREG